jgi:hypothetical protein
MTFGLQALLALHDLEGHLLAFLQGLEAVPWIERKWTNTSGPLSGVMKPKPLASLNHLTVPSDDLTVRRRTWQAAC